MIKTLLLAGTVYVALLVLFTYINRDRGKDSQNYFLGGGSLGTFLGLFTFAATLFSTFTLLGMPDFFRVHGVGAWIFLAVSDLFMVFGIIWLGYYLRKKTAGQPYYGMSGFMERCYESRVAGVVSLLAAFIFLIPYVAIQIRGVSIFLVEAFRNGPPLWVYAIGIVLLLLIYSEIGGLKAIIYSDTLQGILLLIVIWIIGLKCLNDVGGLKSGFEQLQRSNEALLSVPGPKGLFDFQFLFGSLVAICLIPFTQPQVSTRLIIMKSDKSLYRTAIGLGAFAILVILPTVFLGMYGAIRYPEASTSEFIGRTLVHDQPGILGAFVLIGLVAAAISTADSQIFALGGEARSMMKGEDRLMIKRARIAIFIFAFLSVVFALLSSDELVLLARASFAGTALLAPMIFTGIFYERSKNLITIPWLTLGAILLYVFSQFKFIPQMMAGIRLDLLLLGVLSVLTLIFIQIDKSKT